MTIQQTLRGVVLLTFVSTCGWAQQAKVGSLIPASSLGTSTAIPKPTLTQAGGELILSDSPEEITGATAVPAAFYRDSVHGIFRVFYHHQNTTATNLYVGLAITNTSDRVELLYAHGRGADQSLYPNAAGQSALADFLSSQHATIFLRILQPGQSYYSVQNCLAGNTASGIEEYVAIAQPGRTTPSFVPFNLLLTLDGNALLDQQPNEIMAALPKGFEAGTVTVTTLTYSGSRPSSPASLPILSPDEHVRGTFAHFDRLGSFEISASAGMQGLAIDTSAPGNPYSDDMPGEYELGIDAADSDKPVYDDGNYGVLYKFLIHIRNSTSFAIAPMALLMQPTGGAGSYVMSVDNHTVLSPYVDYTSAWWFDQLASGPRSINIRLETSLTGGSAGPQQLYFVPNFKTQ